MFVGKEDPFKNVELYAGDKTSYFDATVVITHQAYSLYGEYLPVPSSVVVYPRALTLKTIKEYVFNLRRRFGECSVIEVFQGVKCKSDLVIKIYI
jgi:hypothetical protein